jgi:hypothetical protein
VPGAFVLAALSCGQMPVMADPEILLIPRGYTGNIFVVYGIPSGQPPRRENGARLYRIPANGVLLTQDPPNTGINTVWKFFYEDPGDTREPLGRIWASTVQNTPENRAWPDVEIFYPRQGRYRAEQMACEVRHSQYYVGTRAQAIANGTRTDMQKFGEILRNASACEGLPAPMSPPPPRPALTGTPRTTAGEPPLMIIYGTWRSGPDPLRVEDMTRSLLDPTDRLLLDSLPGGPIVISGGSGNFSPAATVAQFPHARMIVLFTGPLSRAVRLALPDSARVLYVQEGDTFRRYPTDVRVLDRAAEFTPPDSAARSDLHLWVDHVSGRSGGAVTLRGQWW